jgi:hypothetical protein
MIKPVSKRNVQHLDENMKCEDDKDIALQELDKTPPEA